LVRGDSSGELHDQQLHRLEERNIDWDGNRHNIFRDRPRRLDLLQLHGRGDGQQRHFGPKFSGECDDARKQLHDQAKRTNRIGGVWHNQLRHKPELDGRHSSYRLHHQQLHHIAERNFDWNRKRHIIRRERTCGFDIL
jgi:hypothetical protein